MVLAVFTGTAKQMPWAGWMMAVLMPTTRPAESTSGPPLFPGFRAASVWMMLSTRCPDTLRIVRPRAEMTPAVTVDSNPSGLPMATAFPSATASPASRQRESRPVILNRPFRSVGELGYVFSDTPWKNLDFSTAESGFSPLLDAFCINDSDNADGLVAGKVNLNTRQKRVLMAILAQAYRKNANGSTSSDLQELTQANATILAGMLLDRTKSTDSRKGPLMNLSDLVGRWVGSATGTVGIDGRQTSNYDGFANDLASVAGDDYQKYIARYRETAVRALAANGTTRTWNLMVDLIAQNGHYLPGKSGAAGFFVEGEQHRWVHLAIDRFTGKVIDKQVELVEE